MQVKLESMTDEELEKLAKRFDIDERSLKAIY